MGYHIAIMADSTSRWAEALREISGRLEEMPAEEGFPAYLPSRISEFYERAGYVRNLNGSEGSVTIIGAVSPQGSDFSEPVTQNTKRFVRCFWALDKALAYARHYPAINWNDSYSEYMDDLSEYYEENVNPEFMKCRLEITKILHEENKLMEIVKLIGSDVLPEDQKLIIEIARVVRVGFLQQNAYHKDDTYVPLEKQYLMMKAILCLYEESKKAVASGVTAAALLETGLFEKVIKVFKNLHPKGKFALMAPTGRASRRMAESTGVDEARTLHSALGLGTGEEVGDGERVHFVDADLVIVDEFSMVDMWLAQQFFKRIGQHTRVVLVGDPNQLPSVGAGNVFYELIHSGMVSVTVLDWIFRQSKDGLIAYNAKFINEGSTKLYYGNDFVFVDSPTQIETARRIQDIYCKEAAERGIENVQILSPFREKGEAASEQLNRTIRERVNPFRSAEEEVKIGSRTFRVHDRVMQTKNTEKVSNGDLGFITGITTNSNGERLVQMDFGGDRKMNYTAEQLAHVDLAYATTIHKAMGSEFETVIIPIVKAHTIMLYRNLLYTAVTRAKKKVILVGHKPILFMAVHRADISKRNTMLGERIRLYCKAYYTERNALPELQQAG